MSRHKQEVNHIPWHLPILPKPGSHARLAGCFSVLQRNTSCDRKRWRRKKNWWGGQSAREYHMLQFPFMLFMNVWSDGAPEGSGFKSKLMGFILGWGTAEGRAGGTLPCSGIYMGHSGLYVALCLKLNVNCLLEKSILNSPL